MTLRREYSPRTELPPKDLMAAIPQASIGKSRLSTSIRLRETVMERGLERGSVRDVGPDRYDRGFEERSSRSAARLRRRARAPRLRTARLRSPKLSRL